jgi:hypothetical protein
MPVEGRGGALGAGVVGVVVLTGEFFCTRSGYDLHLNESTAKERHYVQD